MISGVYQIVCVANGRRYIGSARDVYRRWAEHQKDLGNGRHHNRHLQRAWAKYGAGCFGIEILECCDEGALLGREQHWLDTSRPEFNLAKYADAPMRGRKASRQHRARLSKAHRRYQSSETRSKIGDANRGKRRSPEVIEAMRRRVVSVETRARMSAAAKARGPSEKMLLRWEAMRAGLLKPALKKAG